MRSFTGIAILVAVLALPSVAYSQTVYEFDNTTFSQPLPYQQSFFIQGNREFIDGKAVAGKLVIKSKAPESKDSKWVKKVYEFANKKKTYYWWNPDPTNAKYKFLVSDTLTYGVTYNLSFEFYVKTAYSPEIKALIANEVHDAIVDLRRRTGKTNDNEVTKVINEIVARIVAAKQLYKLEFKNGELIKAAVVASTNQAKSKLIAEYVNKEVLLNEAKGLLEKEKVLLQAFAEASWVDLKKELDAQAVPVPPVITTAQILEVESLVLRATPLAAGTLNKLSSLLPGLPVKLRDLLSTAVNHSRNLSNYLTTISEWMADIASMSPIYNSAYDALLDNLYATLGESSAVVEIKEQPVAANAIDKARWSVVLGAGVNWIGTKELSQAQPNGMGYLSFKFYPFSRVDKTVPHQFLQPKRFVKRVSLLGGWRIAGSLRYNGQDMGKVLGIKPVAGVGLDFGRVFTLDFLAVFYTQADKNPFKNAATPLAAPSIGLSIDLDLINRLKGLLSGTGYSLPDPTKD